MSKANYSGAKTYFLILELFAFAIFVAAALVAVVLYQNVGILPALGALTSGFLAFLGLIAISQIGRATIHTAEDTRRMADMMEADRKSSRRVDVPVVAAAAQNGTATEKLVARR